MIGFIKLFRKSQNNEQEKATVKVELNDFELIDQMERAKAGHDDISSVSSIPLEQYISETIAPYYTPMKSPLDIECAKELILDFQKNPSLHTDTRQLIITKRFFPSDSLSFIDIGSIRSGSNIYRLFLQNLDGYIDTALQYENGMQNPNFLNNADPVTLQKNHAKSVINIMTELKKVALDGSGKPIDVKRLITDEHYRFAVDRAHMKITDAITPDLVKLSQYSVPFENMFKKANIKRAIRQRALASYSTMAMFIHAVGNHYNQVVENPKENKESLFEWLHLLYPTQFASLLKEHGLTVEDLMSNPQLMDKVFLNPEWEKILLESIDKFVSDCSVNYEHIWNRVKTAYLAYQTDVAVCANASRVLFSSFFDKKHLSMLLDTENNKNFFKVLNEVQQNSKWLHLSENFLFDREQIISSYQNVVLPTLDNAEEQLLATLHEVRKLRDKIKNEASYDKVIQAAKDELAEKSFKTYRQLEHYMINSAGGSELHLSEHDFILLNMGYTDTDDLFRKMFSKDAPLSLNEKKQLFSQLRLKHENVIFNAGKKDSFVRFYHVIPDDVALKAYNYFRENVLEALKHRTKGNLSRFTYLDFLLENDQIIGIRLAAYDWNLEYSALMEFLNPNSVEIHLNMQT